MGLFFSFPILFFSYPPRLGEMFPSALPLKNLQLNGPHDLMVVEHCHIYYHFFFLESQDKWEEEAYI